MECLESICQEIMEVQRTERYDLMYTKKKEVGWKENHGIQNTGIEDSKANIIVNKRQVLKIWEKYITELYNRTNQPENPDVDRRERLL
jgi:hypothetical protein